jgi:hypothetical protein
MKDFSASNEQKGVCKRRFDCAMAGANHDRSRDQILVNCEGRLSRQKPSLSEEGSNDILRRTNQMVNVGLVLEEGWENAY